MAKFKFLLDNCVRHLDAVLPPKLTVHLTDVGLEADSPDEDVVAEASQHGFIVITHNRRDFESAVKARIAETSKKRLGCTQVHGLVIVKPSDKITQERALEAAGKSLVFEGKEIGWKTVHDECLQVVIPEKGAPKVTRLPRCPHCDFGEAKAS